MSAYTEDTSPDEISAWTMLVMILVMIIAVLAIGYFAWWAPNHMTTVVEQQPTVNTP